MYCPLVALLSASYVYYMTRLVKRPGEQLYYTRRSGMDLVLLGLKIAFHRITV